MNVSQIDSKIFSIKYCELIITFSDTLLDISQMEIYHANDSRKISLRLGRFHHRFR